jgi:hypothetical protein
MIEIIALTWKADRCGEIFPCFTRGCLAEASHVVKIRRSEVVIQLCVCQACLGKSQEAIIQGVTAGAATLSN